MKKTVLVLTAFMLVSGLATASTNMDDCSGDFCAMGSGDQDTSNQSNNTSEPEEVIDGSKLGFFNAIFDVLAGLV